MNGVTEIALEIDMRITLDGVLREKLERECGMRRCAPAEILADIIQTVIGDELFAAVLDD